MNFREFSRALVATNDLDPVYVAVHRVDLPPLQLHRWLTAYILFYDVGVASFMSEAEGSAFWGYVHQAAENKTPAPTGDRWPRSRERRHFRGEQAIQACKELAERHPEPETWLDEIIGYLPREHVAQRVRTRIESYRGMGSWASFKMLDLIDRVIGTPMDVGPDIAMYSEPRLGADVVAWHAGYAGDPVEFALKEFHAATEGMRSPPRLDRPLGFLEAETALCKFKSHDAGRYPIGIDIREGAQASAHWQDVSPTARRIMEQYDILWGESDAYLY